jgi:hypothetical protein
MTDFVALLSEYYTIKLVPQCNRMLKYIIISVTMLVDDMSRNKCFFRFEYHMFYVLYPFVTYLLALPCIHLWRREAKEK